ncbi:hypothetical protein EJ06DRAFT_534612, partial [Trichodelitschia bisporula]
MQERNSRLRARLWGFRLNSTAGQNAKNEAVNCRARRGRTRLEETQPHATGHQVLLPTDQF